MASDAILKPFLLSWFPFLVFSSGLRLPSNVTSNLRAQTKRRNPAPEGENCGVCYSGILHVSGARDGVTFSAQALSCCASSGAVCSTQSK